MRLTRRRAIAAAATSSFAGCLDPASISERGNATDDDGATDGNLSEIIAEEEPRSESDDGVDGAGERPEPSGWRQFGYDAARTGTAPDADGPTEALTNVWDFFVRADVRPTPVTAGDRVFVGSHYGQFVALGHRYGRREWSMEESQPITGSAAVGETAVYVGTGDGVVVALSREDGDQQWRLKLGEVASPVALHEGAVYVGDRFGDLYSIDARTGGTRWSYDADGSVSRPERIGGSGPAVANGRVFVGTAVTDRRRARLHAVGTDDGDQLWTQRFEAKAVETTPAVRDRTVYVALRNGSLYALGTARGSVRWRFDSDGYRGFRSSPAVTEDAVIVGCDDGVLYAVGRQDGDELWRFRAEDPIRSSPSVAGDAIYVGCDDGELYVLDRSTGSELTSYTIGEPVRSSPAVADGRVYVGSDDGNVYVLEEAE